MSKKNKAESIVREIRRKTRKKYSAEEKIRIVLEGLRGEESISSLCRREGINPNLYYKWSKEFLEAGKRWIWLGSVEPNQITFFTYLITPSAPAIRRNTPNCPQ